MEDPSENSEQGLAYGGETPSEEDSQEINSALDETETTKGSLHKGATAVGEGQYEHTSWPTPSPICSSPLSFSCIFLSLTLHFPFFRLHQDQLSR